MSRMPSKALAFAFFVALFVFGPAHLFGGDWPDWRGPDRTGISTEKGLPEKWTLKGENLAWKAPYGGRSAPGLLGAPPYPPNTARRGRTQHERGGRLKPATCRPHT